MYDCVLCVRIPARANHGIYHKRGDNTSGEPILALFTGSCISNVMEGPRFCMTLPLISRSGLLVGRSDQRHARDESGF